MVQEFDINRAYQETKGVLKDPRLSAKNRATLFRHQLERGSNDPEKAKLIADHVEELLLEKGSTPKHGVLTTPFRRRLDGLTAGAFPDLPYAHLNLQDTVAAAHVTVLADLRLLGDPEIDEIEDILNEKPAK